MRCDRQFVADASPELRTPVAVIRNSLYQFRGKIWIELTQTNALARLLVRDTGNGIAPEHLPHIFERFYRADPARQSTGSSSSGLGLSIVEWIVQGHSGSVAVNSCIGEGSCFTVMLPLAPLM